MHHNHHKPPQVAVFDLPIEHTLLVPDYTVFEVQVRPQPGTSITRPTYASTSSFHTRSLQTLLPRHGAPPPSHRPQTLIGTIFPHSEESQREVGEGEVELEPAQHFGHFLGEAWESPPPHHGAWTGSRRGRGRPPLSGASLPARFQCDYCNKGFYYRSMLTAHEKLHTGGKRETCEVCGAEYSTRQNLKNHMIKYHGADSFVPRKRGRPPMVREGGVGRGRGGSRPPAPLMLNHTPPVEVVGGRGDTMEVEEEVQMVEYKGISAPPVHHIQEAADENNGLSGGSDGEGEVEEVGVEEGKEVEELGGSSPPRNLAEEPGEYQVARC